MLAVGLTGGIASGKSIAADAFIARGAPVLNADVVAREVVAPGTPALQAIREHFGPKFILADGTLDRRRMREYVFADPSERQALEQITHPAIRQRLLEWRDAQDAPYCVLDVPILIESGMDALVGRVLVIDTPPATQVARLVLRDKIHPALARQMLAAQATREQRLARADDVIRNEGSVDDLRGAVAQLHLLYVDIGKTGQKPPTGVHLP